MKWQAIKSQKGSIGPVIFEKELSDNGLQGIVFFLDGKKVLQVRKGGYSDICAEMPAEPKMEERFVLTGSLLGMAKIEEEFFESEYKAQDRLREYEKKVPHGDPDELGLKIEKRMVEVAE